MTLEQIKSLIQASQRSPRLGLTEILFIQVENVWTYLIVRVFNSEVVIQSRVPQKPVIDGEPSIIGASPEAFQPDIVEVVGTPIDLHQFPVTVQAVPVPLFRQHQQNEYLTLNNTQSLDTVELVEHIPGEGEVLLEQLQINLAQNMDTLDLMNTIFQ